MIEPLYALRFHNGRRTRPEEETKVKKGVLGIKKKKKKLLLGGSSSTGSCHLTADLFGFHRKRLKGRRGDGGDSSASTRVRWNLPASSAFTQRSVRFWAWSGALRRSGGRSDFDVLWLHHLGQGLLHSEDGEAGGGVEGPTLWHQLQHGAKTLSTDGRGTFRKVPRGFRAKSAC